MPLASHCFKANHCFFTDVVFPHPLYFHDLLKHFGFALKQFHICLCLFGHKKKVLFGGLAEGKRRPKLDEWRQMGGNRQRRNSFAASRWLSCHQAPELKPMTVLRFWVGNAQGHPGNEKLAFFQTSSMLRSTLQAQWERGPLVIKLEMWLRRGTRYYFSLWQNNQFIFQKLMHIAKPQALSAKHSPLNFLTSGHFKENWIHMFLDSFANAVCSELFDDQYALWVFLWA